MKNQSITVVFKDINGLTVTKSRQEWIDELTEYTLDLAYMDGEYANGILDDFLRVGFKGFNNMNDSEIIDEVIEHLEYRYDLNMEV